jgi:hypothetical protein
MNAAIFSRTNFRRAALVSVVALGALGASNGFAAEATTTSTATVIEPIAITKAADLVFGKFAPGGGGTVTVATDGARTASGTILSAVGSSPTAAQFDVTGDADATYSIGWTGVSVLTDLVSSETMTLSKISNLIGGNTTSGEVATGTLSAGGAQSIYLGGTLTVGAAQAAGDYAGDVTVTVEYN